MDDEPARAEEMWIKLQSLVEQELSGRPGDPRVYGINDGFFVISSDLFGLAQGLIAIYQSWFDHYSAADNSRPLLRGAIAEAASDKTAGGTNRIRMWLQGRGFRTAYEDERILRGGRLFCEPIAGRSAEKAGFPVYLWKELSGWEITEKRSKREVIEILWLAKSNIDELISRAEATGRLYEQAIQAFLKNEQSLDQKEAMKGFLQYDETLKLALRSMGSYLRSHPEAEGAIGPVIERYLNHSPNQFRFTWGTTFVALEAAFRGNHSQANNFAQRVAEYLDRRRTVTADAPCVEDFHRELQKQTYSEFRQWYEMVSNMRNNVNITGNGGASALMPQYKSRLSELANVILDRPAQTMAILGTLTLFALVVVPVLRGETPSEIAIGAVVAITSAAAGYYFKKGS